MWVPAWLKAEGERSWTIFIPCRHAWLRDPGGSDTSLERFETDDG